MTQSKRRAIEYAGNSIELPNQLSPRLTEKDMPSSIPYVYSIEQVDIKKYVSLLTRLVTLLANLTLEVRRPPLEKRSEISLIRSLLYQLIHSCRRAQCLRKFLLHY